MAARPLDEATPLAAIGSAIVSGAIKGITGGDGDGFDPSSIFLSRD